MSPPTVSKAETSYPIFAASWAPNAPILVTGGGGGAGRSGVKNKISAFDFTSRAPTVEPSAEIELSSEEDSPTCLASLATKDGLILYTGVNSSEEDRLKEQNEHFRSFEVTLPKGRRSSSVRQESKPQGKIAFLSKTSLLTPPTSTNAKKEAYQRLVRLSPSRRSTTGNKRIGAIASSLAGNENEVIVFSATSTKPAAGDIIERVPLKGSEANDLDILDVEENGFRLAYCADHEVWIQAINYDFGKKKLIGSLHTPRKLYAVPFPDVYEKKGRSKIRCIRWLSPSHLLLLENLPNRTGVELLILRIYDETMGSIILRKRLPRHAKAAVDMDICLLDRDGEGAYQIVIAVAAIDISLHIYTMDYKGTTSNSISSFHDYASYREVHPLQITKLVFSPFSSPWTAQQALPSKKPGPQYIRLASTSLGNTISVETFELESVSNSPRSRYILSSAGARRLHKGATYFTIAFVILVIALLVQSLLDPEGNLTRGIISRDTRDTVGSFQPPGAVMDEARSVGAKVIPEGAKAPVNRASNRIRDLLHLHRQHEQDDKLKKAVVIHHDPDADSSLSTEVHSDTEAVVKRHTEAKTWDELSHSERSRWKEKLVSAGMWAVDEGETILKGIFFSEAAGLVGQVAQGLING